MGKMMWIVFLSAFVGTVQAQTTPVTPAEVRQAVEAAWGRPDAATEILIGESVEVHRSISVGTEPPFPYLTDVKTVRQIRPGKDLFTTLVQVEQQTSEMQESGDWSVLTQLRELVLGAPWRLLFSDEEPAPEPTPAPIEVVPLPFGRELMAELAAMCGVESEWQIRCFDLSSNARVIEPPESIASMTDCGGLPECRMKVHEVSFVIQMRDEADGSLVSSVKHSLQVTPDAPYLSRLTRYCWNTTDPFLGEIVSVCEDVVRWVR